MHPTNDMIHEATTQAPVQHLWAFGAHEIISIAIVGVSIVTALLIAALYYTYKFCKCCRNCRKSQELPDAPKKDANDIEGIFVTRADWDKPQSEMKPSASQGSIRSFL